VAPPSAVVTEGVSTSSPAVYRPAMTTPPPSPPPPERINAVAILVPVLAGVALVLAVTLGVILFTRDDGGVSTTVAATMTLPPTTVTGPAPSCAGSTPGAVIEDYFEGSTCLTGDYVGTVGRVEVWSDADAGVWSNGSGIGSLTTFEGGLFIATYPVEVSAGTIRMHFAPSAITPGTRMGLVFYSGDDDGDGLSERFVFVSVVPDAQEMVAYARTVEGEFGTAVAVPIPPEANLLTTGWNEFVVVVAPEGFRAEINGILVYTWTDPLPATSGRVGVGIGGTGGNNERIYVDDFVVSVLSTG